MRPLLEGDVVVGRGRGEVGAVAGRSGRNELRRLAAAVPAAAEELDALGDDLHRLALARSVGCLPLAPLETAVDPDRAALREVLRAALRLVSPDGDVEVVRLVDPLAGLVLPACVDRDPQLADRGAPARAPQLRVLGQVPDQDDAVHVRHARPPPPASPWTPPTAPTRSAQRTPRPQPPRRRIPARRVRSRPWRRPRRQAAGAAPRDRGAGAPRAAAAAAARRARHPSRGGWPCAA